MTSALGIRASALPPWLDLQHALLELDRPTPCQANPDAWTGDSDPDAAEAAAYLCNTCPAIAACDAFATANRETSGVWAGRSRVPQRGRPVAPRQETAR